VGVVDEQSANLQQRIERIERSVGAIAEELRLLRVPLPPRLLTVAECCAVLSLAPKTVQRLIRDGELRAIPFECGRRRLYRVQISDLQLFIERSKSGGRAQIASTRSPKMVKVPI
jgi:excisionase family DNA binding protein